ncbi:chorion peroxidase [Trichonephila clavipes]|nr:chorion peroxidase [Trichonephila clavipes]
MLAINSGVTENFWAPLQSQVWGPMLNFTKALASVRLWAPLEAWFLRGAHYATDSQDPLGGTPDSLGEYLVVTATLLTLGQPVSYSHSRPTPLNPNDSSDCALIVMSEHKRRSDTSLKGIRYFANFIPG